LEQHSRGPSRPTWRGGARLRAAAGGV